MTRLILITPNAENVEVRCDRCRHWRRYPEHSIRNDHGECSRLIDDGGYGHVSEEDFGCVRFEACEP